MKKSIRNIALGGILALGLVGCEESPKKEKECLEGVIKKEKFCPSIVIDKYYAIVVLTDGSEITVSENHNRAIRFDLMYDKGDTVKIRNDRLFKGKPVYNICD